MKYKKRIIDDVLELQMEAFGATWIQGPKGCGKTTTAKQKTKTIIEFQDEDKREYLLSVANNVPSKLLIGERPILFDEWQDAPKLWGAIRKNIDDTGAKGQFLLTGSSSKNLDLPHTGTLRISRLPMYTMSLYESDESNGSISLMDLFNHPEEYDGCKSDMSIDDIIFAICRGGWPGALGKGMSERARLAIASGIYKQTYTVDISNVDNTKRKAPLARDILRSYSRNICTLAENKTIYADVRTGNDASDPTIADYISAYEKLFIIENIEAWRPAIRSRTSIRASKKRNITDPSIAVAALGLSPEYFNRDFKTLGFLFESLCIRDLRIYSSSMDGSMSYYRDRYGLEADGVLHLSDGRYALIEFKLGQSEIEDGAKHLCEIETLIKEYNKKEKQVPLRLPDLKLVITGTEYGYKRDDGVFVIPIGCLRD